MTLAGWTLLRPWWLLALLPLAWLLWRLARAPAGDGGWRAVVDAHLLPQLLLRRAPYGRWAGLALFGLALGGAVLALAGPALPGPLELAYRSDAARMLVVDLSAAMGGGNAPSARLERTRNTLLDLLPALPPGQTGLIVYAEEPYLIAPLTSDAGTIAPLVPELAPDIMPLAGDRPQRALRMAADLLARSGASQRDLLWITASPATPDALAVLEAARAAGVRSSLLHPETPADPALRAAVQASGGLALGMRADGAEVRALAALLEAGAQRAEQARAGRSALRDLGAWVVLLLLPLALLAFRRGLLCLLALPLLLQPPPAEAAQLAGLWQRADQRAWQLLQAGQAEAAADLFEDRRWRAAASYRAGRYAEAAALLAPLDDADAHYNRGNALARLGRLSEALAAYQRGLRLRPADADLRHNHALVLQLLKQPPPAGNGGSGGGAPRRSPSAPQPGERAPTQPQPAPGAPLEAGGDTLRESGLLAEQWLRRLPADQAGLLRRKLLLEHERRQAGAAQPWQAGR